MDSSCRSHINRLYGYQGKNVPFAKKNEKKSGYQNVYLKKCVDKLSSSSPNSLGECMGMSLKSEGSKAFPFIFCPNTTERKQLS